MRAVIEIGVYGGAVPVATALVVVYLLRRFSSPRLYQHIAQAAAFAVAFFVAWVLLPDGWTPLSPARPWHWLPYLGLLAAVLNVAGWHALSPPGWHALSPRRAWSDSPQPSLRSDQAAIVQLRGLGANLLTAGIAAWLLAPNWPDLEPPRYVYVSLLAGYLFALMTVLDALPNRVLSLLFPLLLFAAASATAIIIAEPVSLTFGQIAGAMAAALFGCSLSAWFGAGEAAWRGLIPVYAVLVGGIAFSASIEPEPPIYAILLAPLAPLALWTCAYGPLVRLTGLKAVAIQAAVVLLPLAILTAWTLLGGEPDYPDYDY